jgi:hypothetical protein
MTDQGIDFQLVPPCILPQCSQMSHAHLQEPPHFGAMQHGQGLPTPLVGSPTPQAILTLNLMRGSRINPKLSAWAQVNGNYDFNRIHIAPQGIRVLVYETPTVRASWSPHAVDG